MYKSIEIEDVSKLILLRRALCVSDLGCLVKNLELKEKVFEKVTRGGLANCLLFGSSLAHLLEKCSFLIEFKVDTTNSSTFAARHDFKRKIEVKNVSLISCLILPAFLPAFSSHVPFIDNFTVSSCKFTKREHKYGIKELLMPDTTLEEITFKGKNT